MPRLAEPARFVAVTAAGVLAWMTQPQRSPERDVVEHLLAPDADHGLDVRALGQRLGLPVAVLAQALFALNRSGGLRVSLDAPASMAPGARSLTGLGKELQALAGSGQSALLASRDGLCISAAGWPVAQAARLAARHPLETQGAAVSALPMFQARLCFAHEAVTVLATANLDRAHPAWVGLARRLLPMCGAMASCRDVLA